MFVSIDDVAAASKKFVEFGCDGIVIFQIRQIFSKRQQHHQSTQT
jgi:hypothetical protein